MNLKLELPEKEKSLLQAALGEEALQYCAPFDLDTGGTFGGGWVAVTFERLIILSKGRIMQNLRLRDYEAVRCVSQVGGGFMLARNGDCEQYLCRFSMKQLARLSYIARGATRFIEGNRALLEPDEPERTCPKCGRAMPGTKSCPRCDQKGRAFQRIWALSSPYLGKFAVISLLMLLTTLIDLGTRFIERDFIDRVLIPRTGSAAVIWRFVLILLFIYLLYMAVNILKNYMSTALGARISKDLRKTLYEKIQAMSLSFLDRRTPGELITRLTHDTDMIRQFINDIFASMFTQLITMAGAIIIMFTMDWKLTLISLVFLPFVFIATTAIRRRIMRMYRQQWRSNDRVNSRLQDVISGMRVVKSYGKEQYEADRFRDQSRALAEIQKRNEKFWSIFDPIMTFLLGTGSFLVTFFGGLLVLEGRFSIGQLTQFSTYAGMLYGPLGWLSRMPRMLTQMATSVERVYDILDEQPEIRDTGRSKPKEIRGEIEFEQVSFGYKFYEPVLENISLHVAPGEMIGLVGPSGAGKSTLINLIMRLYDADDGSIRIDGTDIRDISVASLHGQIGVVLQETFLFSGSIYANIKYARPDATQEEVIRAAKLANAHDFIIKCPDGYDTHVGEHGYNLSGGERQRIAIARAILNDPKILILDEATSALDTETEYQIQEALARLIKGRTTFAIAHRLSTLRGADRLFVIDQHRIIEQGTHNELLHRKGAYYKLVMAQLKMKETAPV
ncbi:MAG: ABC transporter ATP-binding protein [Clostridiales bacterium]|nr:MAG: ABC transporter ATP-binding protein [Clostridiales bacterium]